jgi:3-oxoadipate enol-lactonase
MKLQVPGGAIEYDVEGSGSPVLLLHAFPLDRRMWDEQAAALRASHQVIRFDARGFGGSDESDGPLTMERVADDAAALLDHLGLGQAVVCGVSMGGYAAFALVRRHASRLSGLVLADTKAAADTPEARATRAALAEKVLKEGAVAAAEANLPKLLGATTHRERPAVVARIRDLIVTQRPRAIANALAGLASRADSTPTLREVRVPTLVICGAEDAITPPSDAEVLQKGIAGSRLEIVPAAGHLANVEAPDAFGRALAGFLASL